MRRRSFMKWVSSGVGISLAGGPSSSLARDAVAKVLDQLIYRDELAEPDSGLGQRIVPALLLRFAKEQSLMATDAEMDELESALNLPPKPPGPPTALRIQVRSVSEAMVLDWKVGRALYKRYGGEVIFQQFNPREPVGAVLQFLQDQEKSGAFVIYKVADRDRFYEYYLRGKHIAVPASEADFDKPWWRK